MKSKGYVTVKVKVDEEGAIVCHPDPVKCNWLHGPDDIRWTFKDLPDNVDTVIIEWKTAAMHRGMGQAATSVGARLPDIITSGNRMIGGHYWYNVYCRDRDGKTVAEADPEVVNEPPTLPPDPPGDPEG